MMNHGFFDDDPGVRDALQDLFRERHDGVDWTALNERIIADARGRPAGPLGPAEVLAAWSGRAILTAGGLIAAGLAALLLIPLGAEADTVPPVFWPVAEELLEAVPPDTRRLLAADGEPQELLALIAADLREEMERR